ncbi:glucuronate isomerase [Arthrobacter sp. ISL-85]|uniref:glucuronate isomerase n=1 Tax=Arthrobacter sp. ISL-85 TaxID=2819115 RepID=UPI001BE6CE73|nr:glucuronate isomerase [Arthrobacter sp. ISL-85]MBT2566277.1 glucuronate isomerase [Arthrobacter sp. ISL-85]
MSVSPLLGLGRDRAPRVDDRRLRLHPDRALPVDERQRAVAREIYEQTAGLPLICMHGHVEAEVFASNEAFADPAQLLVVPDHYVTRMLVSQGVAPGSLGVPRVDGGPVETDSRAIWRTFCQNWKLFRGTPSRYWMEHELVEVFGVDLVPSAETADPIYDRIAARIAEPDFRPRQLLDRFSIELISTTDPATSDLRQHSQLARQGLGERVIPTFRPDAVFHPDRPGWRADIDKLAEVSGVDTSTYSGFLAALRERRQAFAAAGGLATDHGHLSADTTPMPTPAAADLYFRALAGGVSRGEVQAFAAHMLFVTAGMACEDGLVMQIHPGVLRDHHKGVFDRHGQDKGFDIPVATEFTRSLRPVLDRYGHDPRFRAILFTVDETVYSRELAPLAGAYPSLRLGAPWWFLDSPEGMRRFRESATETAGFYNTSGFVDDTRAFASIPARHDLFRRIDASFLARLVLEHRLSQDEAVETAVDLAYNLPKIAYSRRSA